MSNYAIAAVTQQSSLRTGPIGACVETFKNHYDWFVVAPIADGQTRVCTKKDVDDLRGDILTGKLKASSTVRVYSKKGGAWDESTPSVLNFAQQHSKLMALYEPVWAFAHEGRSWGILAGIGCATLNAIALYAMTDRLLAVGLALGVLAHFIPGVARKMAPYFIPVVLVVGKIATAIGVLAGMTLFAGLGSVTGMAIGGAIGWTWEDKLPRAPNAPQAAHGAIQSVVLPLVGSLLLWSGYIFVVRPWALHLVGAQLPGWRNAHF